jgi:hypothetical protein
MITFVQLLNTDNFVCPSTAEENRVEEENTGKNAANAEQYAVFREQCCFGTMQFFAI